MARIKIEGMEAVTKELNRIRDAQAPAINRAIEDSVKFGEKRRSMPFCPLWFPLPQLH